MDPAIQSPQPIQSVPPSSQPTPKLLLIITGIIILLVTTTGSYFLGKQSNNSANQQMQPTQQVYKSTSRAMTTPTSPPTSVVSPTGSAGTSDDNQIIAAVKAYDAQKGATQVTVKISQYSDNRLFANYSASSSGPSGWAGTVAKLSIGNWAVIYEGQQAMNCNIMNNFKPPKDLVTSCYDDKSNLINNTY